MANRSSDWYMQARRDLQLAGFLAEEGWHEWACFIAHQAAEKSVTALYLAFGLKVQGHVISRLLAGLVSTVAPDEELVDRARVLDNYFIPTRYPDSHPAGAPSEHYGEFQSRKAVDHAGAILDFVRSSLA